MRFCAISGYVGSCDQAMVWALSHFNEKAKAAIRDDPAKLKVLQRIY